MDYNKIFTKINNENTFLVVPQTSKKSIIKIKSQIEQLNNELFVFKVISINELIEMLSFSTTNEIYLNNLLINQTEPSVTKELIEFSKYNFNNEFLELNDFLSSNSNFINVNSTFINNIKNYSFVVLGQTHFLDSFIDHYNLNIIKIDHTNNELSNQANYLKFNTKDEEIFYLMEQIAKLIKSNVDINDIYILNYSDSDYTVFNKLSTFYNIPILTNTKIPLINIPYINDLMNLELSEIIYLLNNQEILITKYENAYLANKDDFNENINLLINTINKYPHFNYDDNISKKIILNELKSINISTTSKSNGVKLVVLDDLITLPSNSFVYVINARYEQFPTLQKDNKYLSDNELELLNYPSSTKINKDNNNYLESLLKLPIIKQVSFSLKDENGEYAASDIFSKNAPKDLKPTILKVNDLVSGFAVKYYKSYFTNNAEGILQTTFDPSFKVNKEELEVMSNYINKKELMLTPTDITTYLQSPFVYYLERIIGLSTFSKSVNLNLGNFFHTIVEILLLVFFEEKVDRSKDDGSNKFSKDEDIHNNIFNYIISLADESKDKFDFNKYFIDFFNIYFEKEIKVINNLNINNLSSDDKLMIRSHFYIKKHENTIVEALKLLVDLEETIESSELIIEKTINLNNFKGKADLIKIYDDNTYSIIDYKTGNREPFNVEKIEDLLTKLNLDDFSEVSFGALNLLQLVLYSYILSKVYDNYKLRDLAFYSYFTTKLNGITTTTFNDNFYTSSKSRTINNEEDIKKLYEKIEILINQTINKINNVEFTTNLRRDEKTKASLDDSYYSIYEALMFFSEEGATINEEED